MLLVTYISVCLPTYLLLYSFRVTLQEKCICTYVCEIQSFTIDELAKLSNALLTTLLKVCNAINTAHRCSSSVLLSACGGAVTFDFGSTDNHWLSTFELLYGRVIRLPLDILKDSWLANARTSKSNGSYNLMQEGLQR